MNNTFWKTYPYRRECPPGLISVGGTDGEAYYVFNFVVLTQDKLEPIGSYQLLGEGGSRVVEIPPPREAFAEALGLLQRAEYVVPSKETTAHRVARAKDPEWFCYFRRVKPAATGRPETLVLSMRHLHARRQSHPDAIFFKPVEHVFHLTIVRPARVCVPAKRFIKSGSNLKPIDHSNMPEDVQIEAKIVTGFDYKERWP